MDNKYKCLLNLCNPELILCCAGKCKDHYRYRGDPFNHIWYLILKDLYYCPKAVRLHSDLVGCHYQGETLKLDYRCKNQTISITVKLNRKDKFEFARAIVEALTSPRWRLP